VISPGPISPAAAIVAAIERFMRATAPRGRPPVLEDPWLRAAILEGVERELGDDALDPWINT
jgi:hypothetical protein